MQHSTTTIFPDLSFEIACTSNFKMFQNTCQPQNNCCSSALNCLDAQGSIQTCRQIRGTSLMWLSPFALVWTYFESGEGAQNGSDRGDTGAVRTSSPLGSSLCNEKVSFIKLARLTFDSLKNFSLCNTKESCWTFQHFKMNVNIDVSLASTSRKSFARVQGPSHCTAKLSVLDELKWTVQIHMGTKAQLPKGLCWFETLWEKHNDT